MIRIAEKAHGSQSDKCGYLYLYHPLQVATELAYRGHDEITQAIAIGHDLFEDTVYTDNLLKGTLAREGIDQGAIDEVVKGINLMTKEDNGPNAFYWRKIKDSRGRALAVKIQDMLCNVGEQRLLALDVDTQERLRLKYVKGLGYMLSVFHGEFNQVMREVCKTDYLYDLLENQGVHENTLAYVPSVQYLYT